MDCRLSAHPDKPAGWRLAATCDRPISGPEVVSAIYSKGQGATMHPQLRCRTKGDLTAASQASRRPSLDIARMKQWQQRLLPLRCKLPSSPPPQPQPRRRPGRHMACQAAIASRPVQPCPRLRLTPTPHTDPDKQPSPATRPQTFPLPAKPTNSPRQPCRTRFRTPSPVSQCSTHLVKLAAHAAVQPVKPACGPPPTHAPSPRHPGPGTHRCH